MTDCTLVKLGFASSTHQMEFMNFIQCAIAKAAEMMTLGSGICEDMDACVHRTYDNNSDLFGHSSGASRPDTPSDSHRTLFHDSSPPPISPVEPPEASAGEGAGISFMNRSSLPLPINTGGGALSAPDAELPAEKCHRAKSAMSMHSPQKKRVNRSWNGSHRHHGNKDSSGDLAQDVAALSEEMRAVRSDVAAVAKQLELLVGFVRYSSKGNLGVSS